MAEDQLEACHGPLLLRRPGAMAWSGNDGFASATVTADRAEFSVRIGDAG
jgi:hypothetical protein